jgi:putative peptide zinc metalloprotease protein
VTTTTPPPATTEPPPAHADGLELIGEFEHSGYEEPPSLVRLASGQTVQLTDLLYVVLSCIDGRRSYEQIAEAVSSRIDKTATADNVRFLVEEKLRPLGVLKMADGTNPQVQKADPLLGIKGRFTLASERVTRALTSPFRVLFLPPVVAVVLVAFAALLGWLFFGQGLGGATRELLYSPSMLVLTFGLTALSAGFHEFGHAAACRYGGAKPGVIGGGIYLVWPVFFTDVTDSYRLSRGGRLRTDLGGLYFNMLFSLGTLGVWWMTKYDPLLVLIPLQVLQMTHQLMPFVRLDGYYILADITGVPDLFARIKPTLLSMIPGREPSDRALALKPWVRVVVTLWVLAVIPVIAFSLSLAVVGLPRLMATAADSVSQQWRGMTEAFGDGDIVRGVAGILATGAVALPVASITYMLLRLVKRVVAGTWRFTAERPAGRAALVPAYALMALGLAWLWWPNGEYEPLQKGERWTVQETFSKTREVSTGRPGLTEQRKQQLDDETTPTTSPTPTTVADATGDGDADDDSTTEEDSTTDTTTSSDATDESTTDSTDQSDPSTETTNP